MGLWRETGADLIQCPYCQVELRLPEDGEWITCEACLHRLNIQAQQAYARAQAAFLFAQENAGGTTGLERNIYRPKTRLDLHPLEPDVVRAYQQAYSGLRIALQYGLPDNQQLTSIEMLAEITRVFAPRAMISPLEAEYWAKWMMMLTARRELAALQQELAQSSKGFLWRWPRQLRRHQLRSALKKLETQVKELERAIGFLEPLHPHIT